MKNQEWIDAQIEALEENNARDRKLDLNVSRIFAGSIHDDALDRNPDLAENWTSSLNPSFRIINDLGVFPRLNKVHEGRWDGHLGMGSKPGISASAKTAEACAAILAVKLKTSKNN